MTNDWNAFMDSLDNDPIVTRKVARPEKRYPCGQCAGTGTWIGGYVNRVSGPCHACRGTGYFVTSPEVRNRQKAKRQQTAASKQEAVQIAVDEFKAAHPDMFRDLRNAHDLLSGSAFIQSLAEQLFQYGRLSDKQIAAYYRGQEARVAKIEERKAACPQVSLASVEEMFAEVMAKGYKKPTLRAEGFVLSPASASGVNAGALYIKDESGVYMGKLKGGLLQLVGEFRGVAGDVAHSLEEIAKDPKEAAIAYGRKTGKCACCGRELSDKDSVAMGIGPICAGKWGFL